MDTRKISDLQMAGILLAIAFLLSIPFILGYKSIPDEMMQKKVIKGKRSKSTIATVVKRKSSTQRSRIPANQKVTEGAFEKLTYREKQHDDKMKWKLAFSDNFSTNSIGQKWVAAKGKWNVYFGQLKCYLVSKESQDSLIMAKNIKLPKDFRITYDVKTTKAGLNNQPCDMSLYFFLGSPEKLVRNRPNTKQAYLFRVASMGNKISGLSRPGDYLAINRKFKARVNQKYTVVCQKIGNHYSMKINDITIFEGKEVKPIEIEPENRYFGFYTYRSEVLFDNVNLYIPDIY